MAVCTVQVRRYVAKRLFCDANERPEVLNQVQRMGAGFSISTDRKCSELSLEHCAWVQHQTLKECIRCAPYRYIWLKT